MHCSAWSQKTDVTMSLKSPIVKTITMQNTPSMCSENANLHYCTSIGLGVLITVSLFHRVNLGAYACMDRPVYDVVSVFTIVNQPFYQRLVCIIVYTVHYSASGQRLCQMDTGACQPTCKLISQRCQLAMIIFILFCLMKKRRKMYLYDPKFIQHLR